MSIKSASGMIGEAREQITNLSPEEVNEALQHPDTVLIDVRDGKERKEVGKISGSVHARRGLLEFFADPSHHLHMKEIDKDKRIILHCAAGGQSALSGKTLKQMGYKDVSHLDGGIAAWKDAGLPVE